MSWDAKILGKATDTHALAMKKLWMINMKNLDLEKTREKAANKFVPKMKKYWDKTKKAQAMITKGADVFTMLSSNALGFIGILLQLGDKLGIIQPILQLVEGVFGMIGGAAMETLAPAIQRLADVLFSDEMKGNWKALGLLIGTFVGSLLDMIGDLLSDPEFLKVMKIFGRILGNVFTTLTLILGWFFDILGDMSPKEIGLLFYALGIGLAFMVGLLSGGIIGVILGAIYAGIAAIALSPLLFLAEGGYVPAHTGGTLAVLGEGGEGEFVIPESKLENVGGNEEMLWATQDNGDRLDKIAYLIKSQKRLI